MGEHKDCSDCGLAKPLHEFSKDRSARDGLLYCCKPCDNARRAARYRRSKGTQGTHAAALKLPPPEPLQAAPPKPRGLGPIRIVTEYEHVCLRAANIKTLAEELRSIADITLQDGRTISGTSDSGFDIELQDIEHRLTLLVEGRARMLGLVEVG